MKFKKYIAIVCAVTLLLLTSVFLFSCGKEVVEERYYSYIISSFETEKEYRTYSWQNDFGVVKANGNPDFITDGDYSLRMDIIGDSTDAKQDPQIIMYTNNKYCKEIDYSHAKSFEFDLFNQSDRDLDIIFTFKSGTLEMNKGGYYPEQTFTIPKKSPKKCKVELDRVTLNKTWGIDKISEFVFKFPNATASEGRYSMYMDNFIANFDKAEIPEFESKSSLLVLKPGEKHAVEKIANTKIKVFKDGVEAKELENITELTTSPDDQGHGYEIKYMRNIDGYDCILNTVAIRVENASICKIQAEKCIKETSAIRQYSLPPDKIENSSEFKYFGDSSVRVSGARHPENQRGFKWMTGHTTGLKSVVLYIYNNRDIGQRLDPVGVSVLPKVWTRVEYTDLYKKAKEWNQGSPVFRDNETGEWGIYLTFQIWDQLYDTYICAMIETQEEDSRNVEFDNPYALPYTGSQFTTPVVSGSTWEVMFNGVKDTSLTNAATFTTKKGEYVINYTKDYGNGVVGKGVYTLYVEDEADNLVFSASSCAADDTRKKTVVPAVLDDDANTKLIGDHSLRASGPRTESGKDGMPRGFIFNTGITGDLTEFTLYAYNSRLAPLNFWLGNNTIHGGAFSATAQSWSKITFDKNMITNMTAGAAGGMVFSRDAETNEWKMYIGFHIYDDRYEANFHAFAK